MINVLQQPSEVSLSRNEIILKLRASDANGFPHAARSAYCLGFNDTRFATAENISIVWTEPGSINILALTFTASDAPSNEFQFPDDSFPGTDQEYWEAVALVIQSHPEISFKFEVSAELIQSQSGPSWAIRIEAISLDLDWSVTLQNFFQVETFAAKESTFPQNYRVVVELVVQSDYTGGSFKRIARLPTIPNSLGDCTYDISSILNAELKNSIVEPPLPPFGNDLPFVIYNNRRYQIRYTERYGNPAEDQDWSYLSTKQVTFGGESTERHRISQFYQNLSATNALLTWYPEGKEVSTNTPEYLPWINWTGGKTSVYLEVTSYSPDQATPVDIRFFFQAGNVTPNVDPLNVLMIPCGYNQLNLSLINHDVVKYTCVLKDATTNAIVSQTRTFYVDQLYRECERHIFYLNGFNVPQTLRLTGRRRKKLKVNRIKSRRILRPTDTLLIGEDFQVDQEYTPQYLYRSGYFSENEVEALQEMLIYNNAFEIFADGYRRLYLTDKSYTIGECLQLLRSIAFTAEPSVQFRSYSNYLIPASDDDNLCGPDNWQEPDDACWNTSDDINWKIA